VVIALPGWTCATGTWDGADTSCDLDRCRIVGGLLTPRASQPAMADAEIVQEWSASRCDRDLLQREQAHGQGNLMTGAANFQFRNLSSGLGYRCWRRVACLGSKPDLKVLP
jgi:hypothetical protein